MKQDPLQLLGNASPVIQCENLLLALNNAAARGDIATLDWLKRSSDAGSFLQMLANQHYAPFYRAVLNGHLQVVFWLKENTPASVFRHMIMQYGFLGFRLAAKVGQLPILIWYKENYPNRFNEMLLAIQCESFRYAALNGHLNVLTWLKNNTSSPALFEQMLAANHFEALYFATHLERYNIIRWLLSFETVLAFAKVRIEVFQAIIGDFERRKLIINEMNRLFSNTALKANNNKEEAKPDHLFKKS